MAELADIDPDKVFGQILGHDPEVLAASLEKVVKIDDHTFGGVIDPLAGYTATFGDLVPPELADKELPFEFTAVVDDNGRLTQLTIKAGPPQGGGYVTAETRYVDHGVQADISVWYAPVQVVALPVGAAQAAVAAEVADRAVRAGLRARVEVEGSLPSRVRDAARARIPYAAVIGKREAAVGQVSLRLRDGRALGPMPADSALGLIGDMVASRSHDLTT